MFTKMDKAWIAGVVSFLALQAQHWFGFEIDTTIQNAIVGAILFLVTYLVPNRPAA